MTSNIDEEKDNIQPERVESGCERAETTVKFDSFSGPTTVPDSYPALAPDRNRSLALHIGKKILSSSQPDSTVMCGLVWGRQFGSRRSQKTQL